jgi:metal-dependent HD superfamily phosphatase/phosphodiesterase
MQGWVRLGNFEKICENKCTLMYTVMSINMYITCYMKMNLNMAMNKYKVCKHVHVHVRIYVHNINIYKIID